MEKLALFFLIPEVNVSSLAGQVAVSQSLASPTVNTIMSSTPNAVIPPLTPHPTPTTSSAAILKVAPLQAGLSSPSGISNPAVKTEHMQQLPVAASHFSHVQQMVPGQQVGVHMSQQQGMPSMGNFVPGFPAQQMPLNLGMMQPATGAQAPTCQVAVQPQMMPVSSMANHQHPVVPAIGQMPVIVSVQPGMDGLQHGMPHLPENITQMTGGTPLVQMHPIPLTTLPLPPPLHPITCSDMSLPPPLQPLSVMSTMVSIPGQVPINVSAPLSSSGNSQITTQTHPQSPIYEVKLENTDSGTTTITASGTITASPDKIKAEAKCDRVKVENGDDDTIIAENVTIMSETEEQNTESSKPAKSDNAKDRKCSGAGDMTEPTQTASNAIHQSVTRSNGKCL